LTENSFRDVNIAFANELSMVCDKLDVDVWELIRLANRHPRVNILQPGPGVGGHCIAVDPWFIVSQAPEQSRLIRTAREVNDSKPAWVVAKVRSLIDDLIASTGKTRNSIRSACLGLAFKANIDDLRESPALAITLELGRLYPGQIVAVEPHIASTPAPLLAADIQLAEPSVALEADVLVLLVDHKVFASQTLQLRQDQRLLDTRGFFGCTTFS
jgi:UDP-N-acetyl-D-mannosaminuronic acid dehydrogenase